MSKRLIAVWIAMLITISGSTGQKPDYYDTLHCRGVGMILLPRYDTLKQLDATSKKADTIIESLQDIATKLGIKDTMQ